MQQNWEFNNEADVLFNERLCARLGGPSGPPLVHAAASPPPDKSNMNIYSTKALHAAFREIPSAFHEQNGNDLAIPWE